MIEIKNLVKTIDKKDIIKDISLSIKEGEIFGLLGENGAGKTTTLRLIATMLKPTSGTIEVCGFDTVKDDKKVRENIGILFGGETGLYDRLTARENIEYYGMLYDMPKEELKKAVNKFVKDFEMEEYIDRRVANFSKGMKQKTAFARATIHSPKIMLLDEPTSGLDVTATEQVHEFIRESKSKGKTVVFSSHTMSEVEKLCDRVAIIHKGELILVDSLEALKEKYKEEDLEEIFKKLISKGGEVNEL